MIFGEQLLEILTMLEWSPAYFAKLVNVQAVFIRGAISAGGPGRFTTREEARMRAVLGEHGVMLLDPKNRDSGVRILKP